LGAAVVVEELALARREVTLLGPSRPDDENGGAVAIGGDDAVHRVGRSVVRFAGDDVLRHHRLARRRVERSFIGAHRDLLHVWDSQRRAVIAGARGGCAAGRERDDRDGARRARRGRLVVVDRRAALGLPAVLRDEWIRVHHPAWTEDRVGRVADAVVIGVLALVVGPPVAFLRLFVVPDVRALGVV